MKLWLPLLFLFLLPVAEADAQRNKKNQKDEINGDYFLIEGKVYSLNLLDGVEDPATQTQVVIYQGKELYVAFYTDNAGLYSFYLPIGFTYEIWYGGSAFVNKKVWIDATQFPREKKPRKIPLDMGLFRPVEGIEFPVLNDAFVRIGYDPETDQIGPDMAYTEKKKVELDKAIKKAKKVLAKKKKN